MVLNIENDFEEIMRYKPGSIKNKHNSRSLSTFQGMTGATIVRFSPCGRYLASVDNTGLIHLKDLSNGFQEAGVFHGSSNIIKFLRFSPEGRYLTCADSSIHVLDVEKGLTATFTYRTKEEIRGAKLSPDGAFLGIAYENNKLSIMNVLR